MIKQINANFKKSIDKFKISINNILTRFRETGTRAGSGSRGMPKVEEGLTGIRERIIPDTRSLQETVKERFITGTLLESTARRIVADRRLGESHPEEVAEARLEMDSEEIRR